jgi:hypothetical protein
MKQSRGQRSFLHMTSRLFFSFVVSILFISCAKKIENYALIESELNDRNLQLELWQLLENRQVQEARTLKEKIVRTLTSGQCNVKSESIGGLTRPRILECDHGIKGVFKVKHIPYPYEEVTADREAFNHLDNLNSYPLSDVNSELAAYAFDELIELNIVPVTVPRFLKGQGKGSIQYFVSGASAGAGDESTPGFKKMKILDHIINNEDRWIANWLYHSHSHRIIAIDNGRSFVNVKHPANPISSLQEVIGYLLHEPHVASKIRAVTDQELYNRLQKYLRTSHIRSVQERIRRIQAALQ